jgi:membrane-associated phospholipid phosphatase
VARFVSWWSDLVPSVYLWAWAVVAFPRWGISFAAAAGLGFTLHKIIKILIRKPRPFEVDSAIVCYVQPPDRFSMPSGHCVQVILFSAFLLCALSGSWAWLFPTVLAWCVFTAWSRVALGLHDVPDVVAGSALGLALTVFTMLWLVFQVEFWVGF